MERLSRENGRIVVEAAGRRFEADRVVVAMSSWQPSVSSAEVHGVGRDAERIACAVAARQADHTAGVPA